MDHITKDKRFAHIVKDPRFHKMPRKERKIKIDNRFKDMFTDEKFKLKCSVDKRGRTLKFSTNENLKRFYDISDESSSESDTDSSNDMSDDERDSDCSHRKADRISGEENESSGNDKHDKTRTKETNIKEEDSESSDSEEVEESGKDQGEEHTRKGQKKKEKKKKSDLRDQRSEKKTVEFSHEMKLKKKDGKSMKGEETETSDSEEIDESGDDEHQVPIKEGKVKKRKNSEIKDNRAEKDMVKTSVKMDQNKGLEKSELNEGVKKKKKYRRRKKKNSDKKEQKAENDSDSDSSVDKMEMLTHGEIDFARGEAEMSSTSEEDDDDNETDEDDDLVHDWADLEGNVEEVQEATSRLAICNLDWDRITSQDIFTVLNSFKPNNGFIRSVKIYKSEYGKERMEQEEGEGPKELKSIQYKDEDDESFMEDKAVKDSFTERLRQYQFNRLRYYYGVVECDSVGTADHLYKECDGNEYETSCTKFDLRFIPEEMEFHDSDLRSECGDIPHGYQPDYFKNYALAFSKAELTWDETDRKRQQLVNQKFTEGIEDLKDDDLKAYLAESSDEEEADYSKLIDQSDSGSESDEREAEDKQIDKYRKLLQDLDAEEKEKEKGDVQMEITWEMGLKETTEELIKKKSESSDKTVWEKYLDRKKEKKKEKRKDKKKKKDDQENDKEADGQQDGSFEAFSDDDVPEDLKNDPFCAKELNQTNSINKKEKGKKKKKKKGKEENTEEDENEKAALSLLMMDEDDNKKHFSLQKIIEADTQEGKKKKKKKNKKTEDVKKEEDDFELNVRDPRFSAIYESHLYNIDPSAPEYKKTKGSEALVTEKLKRSADPDSRKRANKDKSSDSMKKMRLGNSDHSKTESLASLVKSVKAKTKSFQSAKSFKDR